MRISILGLMFLFPVSFVLAQDENSGLTYEEPGFIGAKTPRYPAEEATFGIEGWVVINFMVDEHGKPFEPSILGSTGKRNFERAALRALMDSELQAATIEGSPIESSASLRYVFQMADTIRSASRRFVRDFARLVELIDLNEKEEAENQLNKMEERGSNNLYEDAYLSIARFQFASTYGTSLETMEYLNKAVTFENEYRSEDEEVFLPPELMTMARQELFRLEVQNQRYGEAVRSYETISSRGDKEFAERNLQIYEQLLEFKKNEVAYTVAGMTDENGSWFIELFKESFHIAAASNTIQEIKLRCNKKYVSFAYQAGSQYKIPKSWGVCTINLLGRADAPFEIDQFN